MTYGLNDICLVPARISDIEHRTQCNPYNADNMLPLFTAPMSSVINESNYQVFMDNKINTIIPRSVALPIRYDLMRKTFVALSLSEFEGFASLDLEDLSNDDVFYICVDIANGHMRKLIDLCSSMKQKYGGRLVLMAGNIANPDTYIDYAKAGIDFVRIGIGGGSVCTTSANGGVHFAMASLIKEVVDCKWKVEKAIIDAEAVRVKHVYQSVPFIVADGGFDNYDKIIKALALGADYVMVGKLFAQCEEACGEEVTKIAPQMYPEVVPIDSKRWVKTLLVKQLPQRHRVYYGMSTKKAQVETGSQSLKTAEGIEVTVPILYTLNGWCDNFIHYLRSMMSYTNSRTLDDFKNTKYKLVSPSEYLSYYK